MAPTPEDDSLAAKQRGVAAFQAKRFEDAVREFTDAISKASSESALDALHTFHGNRCAAFQHLGRFEKAVDDAEACTQIKPTWPKGWAHLGNCKSQLGLYGEAATAYRKVCELQPEKAAEYEVMAEKAEQVCCFKLSLAPTHPLVAARSILSHISPHSSSLSRRRRVDRPAVAVVPPRRGLSR
jgi:tetratricopeptide (TPR) repeat protein